MCLITLFIIKGFQALAAILVPAKLNRAKIFAPAVGGGRVKIVRNVDYISRKI